MTTRKGARGRVNGSARTFRAVGEEIRKNFETAGIRAVQNTAKTAGELRKMLKGFWESERVVASHLLFQSKTRQTEKPGGPLPQIGRENICRYMTRSPHTIAVDRTLADAHSLMRQFRIRHLPVVERGELVGIVSERDLHLIETLRDVNPTEVKVEEAMSQDVFCVDPGSSIARVARMMAERKVGSAMVVHGGKVLGIFSTVDALRALADLASDTRPRRKPQRKPPERALG